MTNPTQSEAIKILSAALEVMLSLKLEPQLGWAATDIAIAKHRANIVLAATENISPTDVEERQVYMKMPELSAYTDEEIDNGVFKHDLGEWAVRNYYTLENSLKDKI